MLRGIVLEPVVLECRLHVRINHALEAVDGFTPYPYYNEQDGVRATELAPPEPRPAAPPTLRIGSPQVVLRRSKNIQFFSGIRRDDFIVLAP